MLHIERNAQGQIIALHTSAKENTTKATSDNDPAIALFLAEHGATNPSEDKFIRTDIELVRVLEDLIELLISKNIIRLTDLPLAAQDKLLNRKQIRDFGSINSKLLVDEDELL